MVLLFFAATPEAAAIPPFDDCRSAPIPSDPWGGFLAVLDPDVKWYGATTTPTPEDSWAVQADMMHWYGYAGTKWTTYDLGCGGGIRDPGAVIDTVFGNNILDFSKLLIAAQHGLQLQVDGDYSARLATNAADKTGNALFEAVFSPWAGVALALAGAVMMVAARRGDVGEIVTRFLLVLLAVGVASLSFGGGAQLSKELAGTVKQGVSNARTVLVGKLYPETVGVTGRPGQAVQNLLYRDLVYTTWADGEVGSYGRGSIAWQLFQNQSISQYELWQFGEGTIPSINDFYKDKAEKWKQVADEQAFPNERINIQGRGESRTLTALGGLATLLPIAIFQMAATLIEWMMYLFVAFLPAWAPLVALLGIVKPETPEKAVRVVGSVVFGGIAASLCGMIHLGVILLVANAAGMGSVETMLVVWVLTFILMRLLKPIVSLTAIFTSAAAVTARVRYRRSYLRWLPARAGSPAGGTGGSKGGGPTSGRRGSGGGGGPAGGSGGGSGGGGGGGGPRPGGPTGGTPGPGSGPSGGSSGRGGGPGDGGGPGGGGGSRPGVRGGSAGRTAGTRHGGSATGGPAADGGGRAGGGTSGQSGAGRPRGPGEREGSPSGGRPRRVTAARPDAASRVIASSRGQQSVHARPRPTRVGTYRPGGPSRVVPRPEAAGDRPW